MSKNRRRGNGNTQCVLPRATLGLLLCSAQVIFTIKTRWTRTRAAIPCDDLFGEACYARKSLCDITLFA